MHSKSAIKLLDDEILARYKEGMTPDLREAALSVIDRLIEVDTDVQLKKGFVRRFQTWLGFHYPPPSAVPYVAAETLKTMLENVENQKRTE